MTDAYHDDFHSRGRTPAQEPDRDGGESSCDRTDPGPAARVIVATPDSAARTRLAETVETLGYRCGTAAGMDGVRRSLREGGVELVLLDAELADGPGLEVAPAITGAGAGIVVLADGAGVELAVEAMRAGALDLMRPDAPTNELASRLAEAIERVRGGRAGSERVRRLRELCQRLNDARRQMGTQVSALCTDLASAYDELTDQLDRVTIASEFAGVIAQELDIEELLRVAMEYVLRRTGPTNAAVYLPDTAGDFTLGAYVNFDRPSDSAEMMFDHLADVVAPRFEQVRGVAVMRDRVEREDRLGAEAHWLEDCATLVAPCVHEDECLAVLTLFRDERTPFGDELAATIGVIADTFAQQLARVIHVHHRHLPKDQWGSFEGPDSDDLDLAA